MTCTLEDQHSDTKLTDKKSVGTRRSPLMNWLFGASLVLLSAVVPATAKASVHHHISSRGHTHRAVRPERAHVHEAAYRPRHEEHDRESARLVHADYRYDRRHEEHDRESARLVHADYRYDRRHEEHDRESARLVHADYRYDRRDEGARLVRADYRLEDHHYRGRRYVARYSHSHLQCVPYAREVSHIELSGDAFLWWAEAAGRYQRGDVPVVGAVMNFRSTGRMPLGHVAVVTAVLDSRTVLVTQANWVPGTITNDVTVEDVSADNDWSEVRVELNDSHNMGSVYPVYGFIYKNAPADMSTVIASNNVGGRNEVAEAPVARSIASEAPNRNLR